MLFRNCHVFLFFLLFAVAAWSADRFTGRVIKVHDGDSLHVVANGQRIKIRLHGIDCPELKQPHGRDAKQFTAAMVSGRTVTVHPTAVDRYGRTVAWVWVDDKSLNMALVAAGMAWHYKKYSRDANLAAAEVDARQGRAGLWRNPGAMAPWVWRKRK